MSPRHRTAAEVHHHEKCDAEPSNPTRSKVGHEHDHRRMRVGARSFNGFRWTGSDSSHTQVRPCLRSCPCLARLAAMFRRNLLILLAAVWVIMPPLAQACASHCAAAEAASHTAPMHDAQSMPGCHGGTAPSGTSHSDGASMAGLCLFAASAALSMSIVSAPAPVTDGPVVSESVLLSSLTTLPLDRPPRS